MWRGLSQRGWRGRPQVYTLCPQHWSYDDLEPLKPVSAIHQANNSHIPPSHFGRPAEKVSGVRIDPQLRTCGLRFLPRLPAADCAPVQEGALQPSDCSYGA